MSPTNTTAIEPRERSAIEAAAALQRARVEGDTEQIIIARAELARAIESRNNCQEGAVHAI